MLYYEAISKTHAYRKNVCLSGLSEMLRDISTVLCISFFSTPHRTVHPPKFLNLLNNFLLQTPVKVSIEDKHSPPNPTAGLKEILKIIKRKPRDTSHIICPERHSVIEWKSSFLNVYLTRGVAGKVSIISF